MATQGGFLGKLFGDTTGPDRSAPAHAVPMLAHWMPYRSFDAKKDVFYNTDSIAWAIEVTPLLGADDRAGDILTQFLSEGVPAGCGVQILAYQSPRVGDVIARFAVPRFGAGGVFRKIAEHRVRFLKEGAWKSMSKDGPFHVRHHRIFVSVSVKVGKLSVDELLTIREGMVALLSSMGVHAQVMSPVDLISLIDDITAPAFDVSDHVTEYSPLDPIAEQCVRRDVQTQVQADRLLISVEPLRAVTTMGGDTEFQEIKPDTFDFRFFSVRNFPQRWAPWDVQKLIGDMFSDKLRPGCPTLTSLCLKYQDEDVAAGRAGYKYMRTTSLADSRSARLLPQLKDQSREWEHVQNELRLGRKLVQAYFTVGAISPKGRGDANERTIKSIYKAAGWDLL
ncbi:MAG: TraC family protein, partial [Jiangellaceae bacterium]